MIFLSPVVPLGGGFNLSTEEVEVGEPNEPNLLFASLFL